MADPRNPANDRQERLESARCVADVVDACHDFVLHFTPAELDELPPACHPPERLDATTIADYAVVLVRSDLAPGQAANPLLKTFALLFGDAAACIARIAMASGRRDGWAYVAWRR